MRATISPNTPEARCYECGSPHIAAVCHHCGHPICGDHVQRATNTAGRPLSLEFSDLGLEGKECGHSPIHCDECMHVVRSPRYELVIVGGVIALVGLLLMVVSSMVGGIVMLVAGIGLASFALYVARRRAAEAIRSRPPLPLLPRFSQVEVAEWMEYRIVPAGDRYDLHWEPVQGSISFVATLGAPDRDQLDRYREKYGLAESEDIWYRAGFIVPRGVNDLRFTKIEPAGLHGDTVIPLIGKVSAHPEVFSSEASGEKKIAVMMEYAWRIQPDPDFLPVRVVPSFVQDAGRRVLEFEVQWTGLRPEDKLEASRIERFEFKAPIEWGKIEATTDNAIVDRSTSAEGYARVAWRCVPINERRTQRGWHSFRIRFANRIDPSDGAKGRGTNGGEVGRIGGQVQVSFSGALSRVTGPEIFYPVGTRRAGRRADVTTYVTVNFEFNLTQLRYQDVHVMPGKGTEDFEAEATLIQEGAIPDHSTVTALTNALNAQDFYVKRVVENPPRTWGHANLVNRCWDVAGRKYKGVHPVDFHLVLTGEEVYSGDMRALGGTTKITLSAQGPYVSEEMKEQVEYTWEQLYRLVKTTMRNLPLRSPADAESAGSQAPGQ
jgi:hypothetical protein